MRDGIDQVRSDLFTVDQLAARSNFGSSGWQLFCARLRQHLIGQSKIIRRAAVTRRDPHTCCGLNVITRPESAPFFLAGIHHRRLFSIRRCLGLVGILCSRIGLKHLEIVLFTSHSAVYQPARQHCARCKGLPSRLWKLAVIVLRSDRWSASTIRAERPGTWRRHCRKPRRWCLDFPQLLPRTLC